MKKIRVLVVEDSKFFQQLLAQGISADPDLEVVATATDPFEARDMILKYRPDVMTLDVELPRMSGIEFLRRLLPQYAMPVVVVSGVSNAVFDALAAGAVDFVNKPAAGSGIETVDAFIRNELVQKIKIASTAKIGKIRMNAAQPAKQEEPVLKTVQTGRVVAIGASTGGTEAIFDVIRGFHRDIPGVVIVQHMPPGFTAMYASRLNSQCECEVAEAKDGDRVERGKILIAAGDKHMRLRKHPEGGYYVECREGEKVSGHCPSVDVLFDSVADAAGRNAIGVILTGMGGDGAKGLLKMREAGAETIGQNESSCVVYGMPKVAYDIGAVKYQTDLSQVSKTVYNLLK